MLIYQALVNRYAINTTENKMKVIHLTEAEVASYLVLSEYADYYIRFYSYILFDHWKYRGVEIVVTLHVKLLMATK